MEVIEKTHKENILLRIISGIILIFALTIFREKLFQLLCLFFIFMFIEMIRVLKKNQRLTPFEKGLLLLYFSTYLLFSVLSCQKIKKLFQFIMCLFILDSSSFIGGLIFGGFKPFPSLSKNKTMSGYIVGLIIGSIAFEVMIYGSLYINDKKRALIVSIITAICGQVGDLIISGVKRILKIKDFSFMIPGHGGFLDRFDSLFLSSIFYYILRVWN